MECLVAIAVIALTGALIIPPLFLAAATRVQNRRAEQALQIAQGELDRIRALVERGEHSTDILPSSTGSTDDLGEGGNVVPAPDTIADTLRSRNNTCNTYEGETIPVNAVIPIDVDGEDPDDDDCEPEFYMQIFRNDGNIIVDGDKPSDFDVGVRVYASSAEENIEGGGVETEEASLRFTSGQGNQRDQPLAVLYSTMTWSDRDFSLLCYHETDECAE